MERALKNRDDINAELRRDADTTQEIRNDLLASLRDASRRLESETKEQEVAVKRVSKMAAKGKASGKKSGLSALFGCVRATPAPVCGLSGGFAEPGVLNASEVLPGCKNARAAARALRLAPPTTRGCSRVHNTPKGVLCVSERAFE